MSNLNKHIGRNKGINAGGFRLNSHISTSPICTVFPEVSGLLQINETLTCTSGTWLGTPTITYQWKRDRVDIVGANSATYLTILADVTHKLMCMVTNTEVGFTNASSNEVLILAI